ncbi:MAG: hypothetical protein KBH81_15725 [Phycisphaerae bacterium]|nr:hypothetical protein [Phycisphaerae bacterium]
MKLVTVTARSVTLEADNARHRACGGGILTGPGVGSSNGRGHWLGAPGELTLVSRDGDPAPFFGPGVTWKNVVRSLNSFNALGELSPYQSPEAAHSPPLARNHAQSAEFRLKVDS